MRPLATAGARLHIVMHSNCQVRPAVFAEKTCSEFIRVQLQGVEKAAFSFNDNSTLKPTKTSFEGKRAVAPNPQVDNGLKIGSASEGEIASLTIPSPPTTSTVDHIGHTFHVGVSPQPIAWSAMVVVNVLVHLLQFEDTAGR